ncbi:MAG: glycerophosphodiester phosphodiesterase family protein [Austwickia sp.]|nr:glycerophosphodiester phosphodiesterase family protein [Austwickia sp.]MBK8436171.1 glycerophosphodiester phosphodiesterase family protein [Austwickia sp.]MBK9101852.1 glycerophosphodiester phosphodiesterase family protein [Austwickia sp.]
MGQHPTGRVEPTGAGTTRRTVLLGCAGMAALGIAGCGDGGEEAVAVPTTAAGWAATRKAPYFIGHRGAGTVVPEHTLESYLQALDWGAPCIEVSTALTKDDVLICMHDLTYDRTTNLRGRVRDQPSSVLETGRVDIPRLGPRWSGDRRPRIPTLEQVLREVGDRAVICLEAKNEAGFEAMIDLVRRMNRTDQVILKLYCRSSRIAAAQEAGFPVFVYADTAQDLRLPGVRGLRKDKDVLVLPGRIGGRQIPEDVLYPARQLGVELWAYPVTRRSEVTVLFGRGFRGFVTPNVGYVAQSVPPLRQDRWAMGALEPGELTPNPYNDAYQLRWDGDALKLDYPNRPSYVTLGQFSPIERAKEGYRLELEVSFDRLPSNPTSHITLAFGHDDDTAYIHREGRTTGYHAVLRADGEMDLFAHRLGGREGQRLAPSLSTPPLSAGEWVTVSLTVTPEEVRWTRVGYPPVTAADRRFRGGYVHVGRSGADGPLSLRRLVVAPNVL